MDEVVAPPPPSSGVHDGQAIGTDAARENDAFIRRFIAAWERRDAVGL